MGYRESVIQSLPLSFWPLDDDVSLGLAKEATGKGSDATYAGTIFDEAIPLVANGLYGTRLENNTASIYFPLPGAVGSGTTYEDAYIWSKGKEKQSFSIELFFKITNTDTTVDSPVVIFGNTSPSVYGVYAYKNKIYFKPDPLADTEVSFQVPDWNRRFHVVANYSSSTISLIINGIEVVAKDLSNTFIFSQNPGGMKCLGSSYKLTVDAVALYGYNLPKSKALDHAFMSRKTINKSSYYNSNGQSYYLPNNEECLLAYKFYNNWSVFEFNNIIINQGNQLSLRNINDQSISGSGTHSFSTIGGRQALTLGATQYLDISDLVVLTERGTAVSVSFYHGASSNGSLLSMQNTRIGQGLGCYTTSSSFNITHLGSVTSVAGLTNGWHELLVENTSAGINVYLDGDIEYSNINSLGVIDECYVGQISGTYTTSPISWVAIESGTQDNPITDHTLYNELTDYTLKLLGNLKWSQRGVATGAIYVPQADYDGSMAFYTASSDNVSITYNNGSIWPREATLPGIVEADTNQVNFYEITITLTTDDSQEDLPILFDMGLYAYANGMKRIISENSSDKATIYNKDSLIIYNDDVEMLDRLDRCGARLYGSSYISIPSQSKNTDSSGFDGTKSISLAFKINEPLTGTKYILKSGSKSLYYDGTTWQYPGFNNIYVNGQPGLNSQAMTEDWVHVVLTSTSKIDAGTAIYLGADNLGANHTDITLGLATLAAYVFDANDVENEYEMLVGVPQEVIAEDTLSFNIIDYGLKAYNFAYQTA